MKTLLICFALTAVLCRVLKADIDQVPACKHKYDLALSGVKNENGDWTTTFSLENWNATSNWTLIVKHENTQEEGRTLTYMRGYLADGDYNVTVDGMRRLWMCENENSSDEYSPKIKHNFGILPYPTWNITDDPNDIKLRYWQTTSNCTNILGCRSKLTEIYNEDKRTAGYLLDNFHVLPDGSILEGAGWDKVNDNQIRINLFSNDPNIFPSTLVLETFGYLIQVAVSLGKLRRDFHVQDPEHTGEGVDMEVRKWANSYKLSFERDSSLSRINIFENLQVISRSEWKAIRPMRELEKAKGQADMVEVKITASSCFTHEGCAQFIRDMQLKQIPIHSDIHPNFVFGRDGRIYEGLGWNWSRKDKVVYYEILAESESSVPQSLALAAFALLLREGVDLGWVSETYTINVASSASKTASARINKWGEWARHIVKENITINLQTAGGDDVIMTRIDTSYGVSRKDIVPLSYPVRTIHFTQSNAICSKRVDCLPFYISLGRKTLRSLNDVKSNFYFVDDEDLYALVHEGLGWDMTTEEDEVVFEFLTPNANTLPSNRSMMASIFLIGEGLKRGILLSDYHVTVGRKTSIEFENLVRHWVEKVRKF